MFFGVGATVGLRTRQRASLVLVKSLLKSGIGTIALASFFFAAMALLTRHVSVTVPAAQLVVIRHGVGLVTVVTLMVLLRRAPNFARPGLLFLRGLLGGISVLGFFFAIERIGAGPATVLNYCAPIYAACFAALFLKEKAPPLLWLGLLLSTVGAACVTMSTSSSAQFRFDFGTLVGMTAGVAGGAAMTTVKAARGDSDALTVFLSLTVVGGVMALPSALLGWATMPFSTLVSALAIGLLACVGQLLFTFGMGYTTATAGSAMTQLVPALVWTASVLFLKLNVAVLALVGAVFCTLGVLLTVIRRN
jgi:drug/metabolite transporter (DMT)-like permease